MSTPTEEGKELTEDQLEELDCAPQSEPPDVKRMRFTVICGCKVPGTGDPTEGIKEFIRDIGAVHVMATDVEDAKSLAVQLLGLNVPDTKDLWESFIVYLGHQEFI